MNRIVNTPLFVLAGLLTAQALAQPPRQVLIEVGREGQCGQAGQRGAVYSARRGRPRARRSSPDRHVFEFNGQPAPAQHPPDAELGAVSMDYHKVTR